MTTALAAQIATGTAIRRLLLFVFFLSGYSGFPQYRQVLFFPVFSRLHLGHFISFSCFLNSGFIDLEHKFFVGKLDTALLRKFLTHSRLYASAIHIGIIAGAHILYTKAFF